MDQKTVDHIKEGLSEGKSNEEIYSELLKAGTSVESIQASFAALTTEKDKEDTHKKTVQIILTVAAILIGAGIFSFIASNWEGMGRSVKVSIILSALIASYSVGWFCKEQRTLIKTGDALILLGAIIYGAGIFLIAQMFNVRANWPDGFILWMLGVIALAYALDSYPLYYIAIPLGVIALFGHPLVLFSDTRYTSFLFTSSLLLLLTTAVIFIIGFLIRKKIPRELLHM